MIDFITEGMLNMYYSELLIPLLEVNTAHNFDYITGGCPQNVNHYTGGINASYIYFNMLILGIQLGNICMPFFVEFTKIFLLSVTYR